jgi:hypothetical protein
MVGKSQQIIHKQYGCCPNINQSPFQNATHIYTSTNYQKTLHLPNLAFHDLTSHKNIPHQTHLVLGLGFKFIQTPKYTTSDLTSTLSRLQRDIHLKPTSPVNLMTTSPNDPPNDRSNPHGTHHVVTSPHK